tara:strand:- start:4413 stop:4661 length:249 start_codon:yes stop_codon:yes gene_type:complete
MKTIRLIFGIALALVVLVLFIKFGLAIIAFPGHLLLTDPSGFQAFLVGAIIWVVLGIPVFSFLFFGSAIIAVISAVLLRKRR